MENESNMYLIQREMLIQSVQLLAASYEEQRQVLPTIVHVPDEVALTFDETYQFAEALAENGLITVQQKKLLDRMDVLLAQMSETKLFWSLDALQHDPVWQQVRALAREIVTSFGVSKQTPQLFWVHYTPNSGE
jgi:hypothetical protein